MEPMKNKEAVTTRDAFKMIVKRGILKLPEISMKTDNGKEFYGAFDKYLTEHKILHKFSMPYRKQQQGPIEGLNTTVARILLNYINDKSVEMNEDYYNWDDILQQVREELNKYRQRDLDKLKQFQDKRYFNPIVAGEPEFEIGQSVHWKMDRPTDILGNPINDSKWRMGDRMFTVETRKIDDILYFPTEPYYRYKLHDLPHVSYRASELKLSKEKEGNYYEVKKIIDKTVDDDNVTWYKCWWKGYLKSESEWVERDQLLEDHLEDAIEEYENSIAQKQSKKEKVMPKKKVSN